MKQEKSVLISKIYVSTHASVVNGIENWGIPKEQAAFQWMKKINGDHTEVTKEGNSFFAADFTKG